jgi:hypothetical protein
MPFISMRLVFSLFSMTHKKASSWDFFMLSHGNIPRIVDTVSLCERELSPCIFFLLLLLLLLFCRVFLYIGSLELAAVG